MKKIVLLLSVVTTITGSLYPVSYQDLRAEFKKKLYRTQEGILNYSDYMKFIELYVIEAGSSLFIIKNISQLDDIPEHQEAVLKSYFNELGNINIGLFHNYEQCSGWLLLHHIKQIHDTWNLP